MRRRINPWIVVITAALTFGSLTTFVGHLGHRSFGHRGWSYRGHYGPMYRYSHSGCDVTDRDTTNL